MIYNRKRSGISELVGVMMMLAVVVGLGVLIFSLSSGGMASLSGNYVVAMTSRQNAALEKFNVEQIAFSGVLATDGSASSTASPAIVKDTTSCSPSGLGAVSSLSWSHTVSAGLSNSILIVMVGTAKSLGITVSTITFGSQSLVRAVATTSSTTAPGAEIWYLKAPTAGTATIIATLSGTTAVDGAGGSAISLSGVDQTTPIPTTNNAKGTASTPTLSIITTYGNSWVIGSEGFDFNAAQTPSGTAPVTAICDVVAGGMAAASSYTTTTTAGSVTTSWTGSDNWGIANAEVKASLSISVSLTTTKANDVIIVEPSAEDVFHGVIPTVSSVAATGLTFTQRSISSLGSPGFIDLELWYAVASSAFSGSITVTFSDSSGTPDALALVAFGVSGANTASPWDSNVAVPRVGSGQTSGPPSVSGVSTSNADDMILGLAARGNTGGTNPGSETAGSGFSLINSVISAGVHNFDTADAEDEVVSSPLSGASLAFGSTTGGTGPYWVMIGDALQAAAGADLYVRNVGSIPTTLIAVYIFDVTANSFVSQTTISATVGVGAFTQIPHTALTFEPSPGHTYLFTVTSALGNSKVVTARAN